MKSSVLLPLTTAAFVVALTASASEPGLSERSWPQWRGPLATGVAPHAKPPLTWSENEHVKWKVPIPGFGTSTPIVWEEQIFILTAIPSAPTAESVKPAAAQVAPQDAQPPAASEPAAPAEPGAPRRRGGGGMRSEKPTVPYQFVVMSLERKTGKVRWQKTVRREIPHEGHHRDHGFASFSPITDGEHLYSSFGSRGLFCHDLEGNLRWEKDLGDMRTKNSFGEGSSPALHGNTLVVNWDHEGEDFVVALDKRTGKELWRQKRDETTSWSTPLIVEHEGKRQVVISATRRIRGYDLTTGEQLWECAGMTDNAIPTPVTHGGILYAISGFRGAALLAIKLGKNGDLTNSDAILWRHDRGTPYVPSPLLYDERLYFHAGNTGVFSCFDAKTGKPIFETERIADLSGGVYASPVAASGRIYLTGRDGKSVVIKHGDKLEVLASNKLEDRFDASPALVGNELFMRGHKHLYCIAE